MLAFFKKFGVLFAKEIRFIFRAPESFVSMVFFSFLILLVLNFVFPAESRPTAELVCPFLWLATLFGGMLRMTRTYEAEEEGQVLDSIRVLEGIAGPFFLSKLLTNLIYLLLLESLSFLMVVILFNPADPLGYLKTAWPVYLLGTVGFAFIGTTFSGMLVAQSRRDLLLPIIAYPILAPLLLGVIQALDYSSQGALIGLDFTWLRILAGFDVIYGVASLMIFDTVLKL